jgi:hypothetical protein
MNGREPPPRETHIWLQLSGSVGNMPRDQQQPPEEEKTRQNQFINPPLLFNEMFAPDSSPCDHARSKNRPIRTERKTTTLCTLLKISIAAIHPAQYLEGKKPLGPGFGEDCDALAASMAECDEPRREIARTQKRLRIGSPLVMP